MEGLCALPCAWSTNLAWFTNQLETALELPKLLRDKLWEVGRLHLKDGSVEMVQACSRRLDEEMITAHGLDVKLTPATKFLGFVITGTGDTAEQKAGLLGALHGKVAVLKRKLTNHWTPRSVRNNW